MKGQPKKTISWTARGGACIGFLSFASWIALHTLYFHPRGIGLHNSFYRWVNFLGLLVVPVLVFSVGLFASIHCKAYGALAANAAGLAGLVLLLCSMSL